MKGHKFLMVTGILMIIAAALTIIAGVFVAGIGVVATGIGIGSALSFNYFLVLILTLAGGICELIAGILGVKYSKHGNQSKKLVGWGIVVIVFCVLSMIFNLVNGGDFDILSVLTGLVVPGLYIYGAVLNSKEDDAQPVA